MVHLVQFTVYGLPSTTEVSDVERYFNKLVPGSKPVVKPFVKDPKNGELSSVITLTVKNKSAGRKAIDRIRRRDEPIETSSGRKKIGIDDECLRVTVLTRNVSAASFDVCFVHGLAGHALNSFSSRSQDEKSRVIWPQDLLPRALDNHQHHGQYITYGHRSEYLHSESIPTTLEEKATDLLTELVGLRGKNCKRPIFFICHSLGGLIVCQAAVLASQPGQVHHGAFSYKGINTVQGIMFFGTPFRGSKLADRGTFAAKWLLMRLFIDTTTLTYLTIDNKSVADIVDNFTKWVIESDVQLITFFELKKLSLGFLKREVVPKDSAKGVKGFPENVLPIGLDRDHRSMVKFNSDEDKVYKFKVRPHIKALVETRLGRLDALEEVKEFSRVSVWQNPDAARRSSAAPRAGVGTRLASSNFESDKNRDVTVHSGFYQSAFLSEAAAGVSEEVELFLEDLSSQRDDANFVADKAAPGTCSWILSRERYQRWKGSESNSVLFLEGHPGVGKSVLARYVIEALRKENESEAPAANDGTKAARLHSAIIVAFFCKKGRHNNSVLAILRHILQQIAAVQQQLVRVAARKALREVRPDSDIEYYWKMLGDVRKQLRQDLICVIDGFDECMDGNNPDVLQTGQTIPDFLRAIARLEEELNVSPTARTKVLLTTRPRPEIAMAVSVRLRMTLQASDIQDGVRIYVEQQVKELAESRNLPKDFEELLVEEVFQKCSPIFQMARQLLQQLQNVNLGDRNQALRTIREYPPPDELASAYRKTIDMLDPTFHEKAGRLIRLLHFVAYGLTADEIRHALAVRVGDPSAENFLDRAQSTSLDLVMSGRLGSLIKKESDDTFDLQHASVKEFFQSLSPESFPDFSCQNEQEGHFYLAQICVGYLTIWRSIPVSAEEIAEAGGNELSAKYFKSPFLDYAARCWTLHTAKAGPRILGNIGFLAPLLETENNVNYVSMCLIRYLQDWIGEDEPPEFDHIPPDNFLAQQGLYWALSYFYKPQIPKRHRILRFLNKRQAKKKTKPLGFDRKVNLVDSRQRSAIFYACESGHEEAVVYLLLAGASGLMEDSDKNTPFSLAVDEGHENIAKILLQEDQARERGENEKSLTSLHMACSHKMEVVVKVMLLYGISPNATAFDGWTSVHVAAGEDNVDILNLLLEKGGDCEKKKQDGGSPLSIAASQGHVKNMRALFQAKPSMDPAPQDKWNRTPLYRAAAGGYESAFDFLFEKQSEVQQDEFGQMPIHAAAIGGHLNIIKRLTGHSTFHSLTKLGRHSLHLAAGEGHLPVVRYLVLDKRVDPNMTCDDTTVSKDLPDAKTITPLYLAVSGGHEEVAKFLLGYNPDLELTDSNGRGLSHQAARSGCLDILKALASKGINMLSHTDKRLNPFHFACATNQMSVVRAYVKNELTNEATEAFTIDVAAGAGETGLWYATSAGGAEVVEYLLDEGANLSLVNEQKQGPIHLAASVSDPRCLRLLLGKEGVDVNQSDVDGLRPLHLAAGRGFKRIVTVLLENGADVDPVDTSTGDTPLMVATETLRKHVVDILLEHDANPNLRNGMGMNAMDLARHNPEIFDLFRRWTNSEERLSSAEERVAILRYINQVLERIMPSGDRIEPLSKWMVSRLGLPFRRLGDIESARICYEYHIVRSKYGSPYVEGFTCDKCRTSNPLAPALQCLVCPDLLICETCLEDGDDGVPRECSTDHAKMEIGGTRWKNLAANAVNESGQTMEAWLAQKKSEVSALLKSAESELGRCDAAPNPNMELANLDTRKFLATQQEADATDRVISPTEEAKKLLLDTKMPKTPRPRQSSVQSSDGLLGAETKP